MKRSHFCNLQNFVELYYLLHLMIERKHLHFSSQSLLRKRRLCTINHVLEIHNNTTKKFSNFFLFFVLFFVISKQGEKGFSSEKFFNLEKEDSTILFQLIIYGLSCEKNDVSRVKLESFEETKSHAKFTDLKLILTFNDK